MLPYSALVVVGIASASTANDKLVFVQAVWRHGDRAPTTTFPNDPYQESHWPQGWGELSPRGMSQHLHLGVKLAQKYVIETGLVSNEYKSNEVYVRSSDVNRTLLSATSNFIGFYGSAVKNGDYPRDEPSWPAGFVPIPVHTIDEAEDYLLTVGHGADCSRLQALQGLWKQTKEYKIAVLKYQDTFDKLTKLCGQSISFDNIFELYTTLFVEKLNGLKIDPEIDALYGQIKEASDLVDDWTDGIGLTPVNGVDFAVESSKIRGGSLLWAMIEHMSMKIQCLEWNEEEKEDSCRFMDPLKYYAYSAHDTTVSALFSTFGFKQSNFNETGYPTYSSCVTVELWQTSDSAFYVKVIYWPLDVAENKRAQEDLTKFVKGCEHGCTLDQFAHRSVPYRMTSDAKTYCANADGLSEEAHLFSVEKLKTAFSGMFSNFASLLAPHT